MVNPLARRRGPALLLLALWLWPLWTAPSPAVAAGPAPRTPSATSEAKPEDGPAPDDIKSGLMAIKARLDSGDLTPALLSGEMREVAALRQQATQCQQIAEDQLARVQQAIAAVGVKQEGETAELSETRQKIEAYKSRAEGRRAECRLHIVFADSLVARIDTTQKTLLTKRLTERGPGILDMEICAIRRPGAMPASPWSRAASASATPIPSPSRSSPSWWRLAPLPGDGCAAASRDAWCSRRSRSSRRSSLMASSSPSRAMPWRGWRCWAPPPRSSSRT